MAAMALLRGGGAYWRTGLTVFAVFLSASFSILAKADDDGAGAAPPAREQVPLEKPKDEGSPKKKDGDGPSVGDSDASSIRASNVTAVYRISFLGSHVGDFKLRSSITNRQYSLQANADLSVFFGSMTWQGVTSSRGLLTANGPVPASYAFRYSTAEKRETVELKFTQRMVQDIVINPPQRSGFKLVPITAAHLQNVVDPLSAVILLAQARMARKNESACNRRLPIFDGKLRYDLVLSPKGTRTIETLGRLRGTAYVCSVRYVPIAGQKVGKQGEGDYMTGNTGIEIWLVPVPEAGLMAPYYISVPTPAGAASMTTVQFDVDMPPKRHARANP